MHSGPTTLDTRYATPEQHKAILAFLQDFNDDFPILNPGTVYRLLSEPESPESRQLKGLLDMVAHSSTDKPMLQRALAAACTAYIDEHAALVPDGPYFVARYVLTHALYTFYRWVFAPLFEPKAPKGE